MSPALKARFDAEMGAARSLMARGQLDAAFTHIERAHVLGQRHVLPHARTHLWFLKLELLRRRPLAMAGQVVRLLLGVPGSLLGLLPRGNTGGSNVGMFRSMPVPAELAAVIECNEEKAGWNS